MGGHSAEAHWPSARPSVQLTASVAPHCAQVAVLWFSVHAASAPQQLPEALHGGGAHRTTNMQKVPDLTHCCKTAETAMMTAAPVHS